MRILQTPVRLFATGGVESYVCSLARELVGMGHDIRVICAGTPVEHDMDLCVSVKTLRTWGKIANTNITPALPLALFKENFDILHTHLPTPWSADWSSVVSTLKKRPLVLTYHNDIVGKGAACQVAKAYNATALKVLLKSADRIIVTRRKYLSSHLNGYEDKIAVVPIGIDTQAFRPLTTHRMGDIFFLSVLDEYHRYKGLDCLLRALKIIRQEIPEVKLVVGGSGVLLDHYKRLTISLGLEKNVEFAGFIPADQILEYYNGCNLFVLPSSDPAQEGFGIVLLEAMACGKPVVATEIAGPAEDITQSGAGIIVRHGDDEALAKAMLRILKADDLMARMGSSGRRLVKERYSWRKVAEQMDVIYRELI